MDDLPVPSIDATLRDAPDGAYVEVPPGTYRECLVIDRPVTLVATDPQATEIHAPVGASCVLASADATLHGFRFVADLHEPAVRVVAGSCDISGCLIEGQAVALAVEGDGTSATLRGSIVDGVRDGILVGPGAACLLEAESEIGPVGAHLAVVQGGRLEIRGDSTAAAAGLGGIAVAAGGHLILLDCKVVMDKGAAAVDGFALRGLVDAAPGCVVELDGCSIRDGGGCGLYLDGARATARGSAVHGNAAHGVAVVGGGSLEIGASDGDRIDGAALWAEGNGGDGIHLEGNSALDARNLAARHNGGAGVAASASRLWLTNCPAMAGNEVGLALRDGATAEIAGADLSGNRLAPIRSAEDCTVTLDQVVLYGADE